MDRWIVFEWGPSRARASEKHTTLLNILALMDRFDCIGTRRAIGPADGTILK